MTQRHFNLIDRLLIDTQNALGTVFGSARAQRRASTGRFRTARPENEVVAPPPT